MGLLALWLLCISTLNPKVLGNEEVLRHLMPQEVKFHSLDYRNVLHWKTPSYTNQSLKYFVQYKVYGDKQWTNVTQCQGTSQQSCDLSQQTSDPREWYYARVQAALLEVQSRWALSPRFNPDWETSVSAPSMKLSVTEQGIVVRLRPPRSPYRRRQGSFISMRKLQNLTFRIFITHNGVLQETHEMEGCVTKLLIADLNPQTTYCLQAEARLLRQGRSGARSDPICITTLRGPEFWQATEHLIDNLYKVRA